LQIDVVIPSRGRVKKLENCLNSIFHAAIDIRLQIYLYFSVPEEYTYFLEKFRDLPEVTPLLLENYRVPDFWNTHLRNTKANVMCYLNDDVLVDRDLFKVVMKEFYKKFPDYDGIIGFRQTNIPKDSTVEGAFGAIGIKYADRFPKRQVLCPNYERFYSDFELWKYASHINRFYFCDLAMLTHLHPMGNKELEDDTHRLVRQYLKQDRVTHTQRQQLGYLWGKDFNLV